MVSASICEFWWGNNSVHNRYKTGTFAVHYLEATSIPSKRVLKSIPVIANAGQLPEKTSSSTSIVVVFQSLSHVWPFVTLCDPMDYGTPGFPVLRYLPKLAQTCLLSRWCHSTISSSVTLSPLALNLSQHQGLFQWVSSSHQVAKQLEFQLQHQSFQWIFRTDFL